MSVYRMHCLILGYVVVGTETFHACAGCAADEINIRSCQAQMMQTVPEQIADSRICCFLRELIECLWER
jgi:hypothetical protein